jgi:hypothetical protein
MLKLSAPLPWAVNNGERSINPLILHARGTIAQGVSQAMLESIGVSTEG